MIVAKNLSELKLSIDSAKAKNQKIGFVPTMGYLHQGHISLVEEAKRESGFVVMSIFVNPKQFNDPNDFLKYPVDLDGDLNKCKQAGVDLVFYPSTDDLYPSTGFELVMTLPLLQKNLCGRTRPGHFEGVMLIVSKLFHLVQPDLAYFGQKDFQQFRIIQEMVRILNFPIEVKGIETLREADGLAMSSRNVRLSPKEREVASMIPRMFSLVEKLVKGGERKVSSLREIVSEFFLSESMIKIDYIEFVDPLQLQELDELKDNSLLAIAIFVGQTRLIDNRLLRIS
ncbi:pantothenate synthetase [Leptospira ryugenii]|uniref:Pantothenate synthetase n=1 Tax=Leptospira ryugenii TaxID=1917863 RepID=A0A2P2DX69_9LEPT|nr:pantoate--beta-alanine ligase [Leptospira ryugenii]GBF49212.1 pantothenate synthetase [Leptospira ryugenii]